MISKFNEFINENNAITDLTEYELWVKAQYSKLVKGKGEGVLDLGKTEHVSKIAISNIQKTYPNSEIIEKDGRYLLIVNPSVKEAKENKDWTVTCYNKKNKVIKQWDILDRTEHEAEKEAEKDLPECDDWTLMPKNFWDKRHDVKKEVKRFKSKENDKKNEAIENKDSKIRIEISGDKKYSFILIKNGDAKNGKEISLSAEQRSKIEDILNK